MSWLLNVTRGASLLRPATTAGLQNRALSNDQKGGLQSLGSKIHHLKGSLEGVTVSLTASTGSTQTQIQIQPEESEGKPPVIHQERKIALQVNLSRPVAPLSEEETSFENRDISLADTVADLTERIKSVQSRGVKTEQEVKDFHKLVAAYATTVIAESIREKKLPISDPAGIFSKGWQQINTLKKGKD